MNFLDERGISITLAASHLGVIRKTLSELINGKARCSHAMARRLAETTGTDVSLWIMIQAKLDTWKAENMDMSGGHAVTPFPFHDYPAYPMK